VTADVMTDAQLNNYVQARSDTEQAQGAEMFMGRPDRWFADPHWLCGNGHVSVRYLKSEQRGDLCLACLRPVRLTFPEDVERTSVADEVDEAQ